MINYILLYLIITFAIVLATETNDGVVKTFLVAIFLPIILAANLAMYVGDGFRNQK